MPKTQDKNSSATKVSKTTTQASGNSCGATGHPGTSITPGDLLEAIKDLKSEMKGDNDNLRKDINSFHTEVSSKLDGLAEEMQGLGERMVRTYTSAHDAGRELQRRGYSVEVPAAKDEEDPGVTRLKELLGWQRQGKNPQGGAPTAADRAKEKLRGFQRSPTE
ncbi:hypothetical protein PAMP_009646 [Pampus punctatissimus]